MNSHHKVRRLLPLSTAALAIAVTAACGGGSSSSGSSGGGGGTPVTLRLDFVHTGKDAIWTYGVQQGFFKDAGIDLKVEDGKGSATTGQTVGNGSDDFGLIDSGTVITLAAKGVPVKAVASVFAQSPVTILSPEKSPVTTPQQLVGKKIAITSGDGPSTLLPALLDANHIDKNQVTLVNLQPQAKLTSLLSGGVDTVSTIVLVQATLAGKGMKTHSMPYRDFGVKTPGYYLTTSKSYLSAHQDLVQKVVQATQKSIDATIANPQAAIASFEKVHPEYNKAQANAELNLMLPLIKGPDSAGHPTGWMSVPLATSASQLLAKYGGVTTPKPVNEYLTNEFVK